jgi:adenosylcobinamide kinase / adenosylcobinamide-phosphate guanylyltransferase
MGKLIFIIGGARSGKSRYAVELAKKAGRRPAFIATAAARDKEMMERIRLHKASRPRGWKLFEEPRDISAAVRKAGSVCDCILIDCLGLWVSNLLMDNAKDKEIERKKKEFISSIFKTEAATVIVVSNDVGAGIVPADPVSRRFRDLLGLANQAAAKAADEVIFMQAGIPVKIK